MKQPPRPLLLVAAFLALFFVPAPGLEPGPRGAPPVQAPFALASALEEVDLGLASSFPTVSARRAGDGPALPPAALLVLPMLLAVASFLQVLSGPPFRAAALIQLRGPPAGTFAA